MSRTASDFETVDSAAAYPGPPCALSCACNLPQLIVAPPVVTKGLGLGLGSGIKERVKFGMGGIRAEKAHRPLLATPTLHRPPGLRRREAGQGGP